MDAEGVCSWAAPAFNERGPKRVLGNVFGLYRMLCTMHTGVCLLLIDVDAQTPCTTGSRRPILKIERLRDFPEAVA